jgi:hypothetical protein
MTPIELLLICFIIASLVAVVCFAGCIMLGRDNDALRVQLCSLLAAEEKHETGHARNVAAMAGARRELFHDQNWSLQ